MNSNDRIIYHATYMEKEFPEIRKSRFTKDFSWGFYCTEIQEQAEQQASKFNESIVNVYRLRNIKYLNVKIFSDYSEEWLQFIVSCRNGQTHEYDVVIGPRADDTIYDYIEAYTQEKMNQQRFFNLMKSQYPAHQISLHTIKSLVHLDFIRSYSVI